jgi:hypothetical protein
MIVIMNTKYFFILIANINFILTFIYLAIFTKKKKKVHIIIYNMCIQAATMKPPRSSLNYPSMG